MGALAQVITYQARISLIQLGKYEISLLPYFVWQQNFCFYNSFFVYVSTVHGEYKLYETATTDGLERDQSLTVKSEFFSNQ